MQGIQNPMLGRLIQPEIQELITNKRYKELRETLIELDPADISESIVVLSQEERAILFRILPRDVAADVFEYLHFYDQEELLRSLGQEHVSAILNEMEPDDRTALLEELPGKVTSRLMKLLTPAERKIAKSLLGYPEDSIGRRMTPEYVAVKEDWTVAQVMEHIRKTGEDKETINVIYVIEKNEKLVDDLRLRMLIFADPQTRVSELMDHQFVALSAMDDQETAIEVMTHYDRIALPVIDSQGTLVGIVTADDVFDVVEEETTEDVHRMGGMEALDEPYSQVRFYTMIRKRAGWLFVLFVGEVFTIWAMQSYSDQIKTLAALTFFIPLIISCGGNSGSQVTSLVIRAMAVQDIKLNDWYRVMSRELMTGVILGCILGTVALVPANIFVEGMGSDESTLVANPIEANQNEGNNPNQTTDSKTYSVFIFAIAVSTAVFSVVVFGTLIGCMLPFILSGIGFDPAFSSAPLVATIVDLMGVFIYFSVATLILGI